ncbi:DegT/DnrJ/EryC1/StrS family aminotransferase [Xanthomonas cassavae CFBP 4642]|uniref:DegT/DnrJ/EryC1/StrS family aminotransferase n=1 Tax=Xanthomonas cassavae CFBP 4642 TaxID=1219375 RepID=A0ABS8HG33_9XANT|nr:DegT/DnrJ/EryC1/StrS family aminotransferase [Xanthomonas cassavae]MCC4620694.1 DegT/DnrJ/EryC1/StrS family aminotransferase [Xanthomonas cassavae CFBP 4642]
MLANKRIPVAVPSLAGNEKTYVNQCLDSTWISSAGEFIGKFETNFAEFCGVRHAVAINNGTTAIHLALVALGIGAGDEVLIPTLTYIATANAVAYCNAIPVLVESEPGTMNLDAARLEAKITPRTKAIIVVHLYGHPVDMDPILAIARRHNLKVIEDAAEAHGAEYKGVRVGGLGDCATFSFFGNKIVTTGEGGMVTTNDDELAARLRLYRGQGMDPKRRYWFPVVGFNYRMTNLAAAIGLAQMERVDEALAARQRVASWYEAAFAAHDDLVERPFVAPYAKHVYWMYTVLLKGVSESQRDQVMALMDKDGIETRPLFYPMHVLPPYLQDGAEFPVANDQAARGMNLPTHAQLDATDVERVVHSLASALRQLGR